MTGSFGRNDVVDRSYALLNVVRSYSWGSRDLLAGLRGEPGTAEPEAELWMGAHPSAPSVIPGTDGDDLRLDLALAERPQMLGGRVEDEYGRLPYLVKLLAAGEPLSLQAHPTKARAEAGFMRETAAGIELDDPSRSYKDDNHKPELICALTPFRALSGFRSPAAAADLLEGLEVSALAPIVEKLHSNVDAAVLLEVVESVLSMEDTEATTLADEVAFAVRGPGANEDVRSMARRVAETHPGDVGIVVALLLELVTLKAGEAIYLGAGRLHAYIDGLGVEIMAASDNVLRGGLTPKHVDVSELVATLAPKVEPIQVINGVNTGDGEFEYVSPAREFSLSRFELEGRTLYRTADGPEIVVVTAGSVVVDGEECSPTSARFLPDGREWSIAGHGQAFRARVPRSQ